METLTDTFAPGSVTETGVARKALNDLPEHSAARPETSACLRLTVRCWH
jgi:hypothetical protein